MNEPLGINPPAIVRQDDESASKAGCFKALKKLFESIVLDKRAVGVWLRRLKDQCDHGEWKATCDILGIPLSTADRWVAKSGEEIKLLTMRSLGNDAMGDGSELTQVGSIQPTYVEQPALTQQPLFQPPPGIPTPPAPPAPPSPVSETGRPLYCPTCQRAQRVGQTVPRTCVECKKMTPKEGAAELPPAAGQTEPSGEAGTTAPGAGPAAGAPDVGDAAEELPPGTLLDPEGAVLPDWVREALEGATEVEKARVLLRQAVKEVKAFAEKPAGRFVDASHITKRITAAVRQMNCHVLTATNTFVCDGVGGHGCAGVGCSKCKGLGAIPKPLVGDQGPKPKPKYYGRRR